MIQSLIKDSNGSVCYISTILKKCNKIAKSMFLANDVATCIRKVYYYIHYFSKDENQLFSSSELSLMQIALLSYATRNADYFL